MKYHTWTNGDISFLSANYLQLSWEEIAQKIGVSVDAVKRKSYDLGFKKPIVKPEKKTDKPSFKLKHEAVEAIYDVKPVFCRPISVEKCTPIKVGGATIYVRPGKDPEEVRRLFENRSK